MQKISTTTAAAGPASSPGTRLLAMLSRTPAIKATGATAKPSPSTARPAAATGPAPNVGPFLLALLRPPTINATGATIQPAPAARAAGSIAKAAAPDMNDPSARQALVYGQIKAILTGGKGTATPDLSVAPRMTAPGEGVKAAPAPVSAHSEALRNSADAHAALIASIKAAHNGPNRNPSAAPLAL